LKSPWDSFLLVTLDLNRLMGSSMSLEFGKETAERSYLCKSSCRLGQSLHAGRAGDRGGVDMSWARGNNRQKIFMSDKDYETFSDQLLVVRRRFIEAAVLEQGYRASEVAFFWTGTPPM